jgi:hypothetical protein
MAVVDSPKLRRIRVVYEIEIELDAPSRGEPGKNPTQQIPVI